MNGPIETRWRSELRFDATNGMVQGTVMRYGDVADIGGEFRETFLPGSLEGSDVILNLMHDRRRPLARGGLAGSLLAGAYAAATAGALGYLNKKVEEEAEEAAEKIVEGRLSLDESEGDDAFGSWDSPQEFLDDFTDTTPTASYPDSPGSQFEASTYGDQHSPHFDPGYPLKETKTPGGSNAQGPGDQGPPPRLQGERPGKFPKGPSGWKKAGKKAPRLLGERPSPRALVMRAKLIRTADGITAMRMLHAGLLRGLSVEFRAIKEDWREHGALRVIERAHLSGIGLVDRPAYPQSSLDHRAAVLSSMRPSPTAYFL